MRFLGQFASLARRLSGGAVTRRETESEPERFGPVPLEDAAGAILAHNVSDAEGRPLLRKGRALEAGDLDELRALGRTRVYVARPRPGDVHEDAAAERVARALAGDGLRATPPAAGRVNLIAEERGVVRVDAPRLLRLNAIPGVTAATLRDATAAGPGQTLATVKIIPFSIRAELLEQVEALAARGGALMRLDPLPPRRVALLVMGAPAARDRIVTPFESAIRARVEALGSSLEDVEYLALDEEEGEERLAEALDRIRRTGVDLLTLAGETAVGDEEDIIPRAIRRAGGEVTAFGAPVDPGNLLLVARIGSLPVLGAPGCARSPRTNVIDRVLPRLLAGERLDATALASLGHGGLLEDVPERRAPRSPDAEAQGRPRR